MSEKDSSNANADLPEETGSSNTAKTGKEDFRGDSELPTFPDGSREPVDGEGEEGYVAKNTCPTCGADIPPEAPGGICPKCALVGAAVTTDRNSVGERSVIGPRFQPPEIETVAAAFPQLEIVELIGCGGMGAVYKARQPHLDRFVALKVLPPSLAETPGFTERFTREGRLLAKLNYPAIVGVHDFGQAGGFFFLLMEFVDGVNLRQAMRAGRFTPEQALEIVPKICEALQFAHDEGVLHRDIKPENILLDAKGTVKIADFGIAKLLDAAADPTLTGSLAPGTPHYMAPEQIEQPAEVDHRADIYSLGVVFYEMLTGELPIGRFAAPSEKTSVDSQVDEIVFRSLEKERDRRQQSAGEVKTEIEGVPVPAVAAGRHPGYAIPSGSVAPGRSSGGRKAALIVLIAFLLPFIMNIVALVGLRVQQVSDARSRVEAEVARTRAKQMVRRAEAEIERLNESLAGTAEGPQRAEFQRQLLEKQEELSRHLVERKRHEVQRAKIAYAAVPFWAPLDSLSLLGIMVLAIGIPGTVMGWKSLRRIRALGLPEGRGVPMFAALFFPLLVLTIVVFCLVAIPASRGPRWVNAMGISGWIIVSLALAFWVVRLTWRWAGTAAPASERASVLADFERPPNPWLSRILVLTVVVLAIPALATLFYLGSGGGGPGGFLPGFFELLVIAAIVGLVVWLILTVIRRNGRPAAAVAETAPAAPVNPWPRRVFWLIVILFVAPVLLIVVGLLVPWLAYQRAEAGESHRVRILEFQEQEQSVSIRLESRRFSDTNVNVAVIYEGPRSPNGGGIELIQYLADHSRIVPGQSQEWNLFGEKERTREDVVTFALPDRETTEMVSREIVSTLQRLQRDRGLQGARRIDLFNVMTGEAGPWRAWIQVRAGPVVGPESPPVEELLVGQWHRTTSTADGSGSLDVILTLGADRSWKEEATVTGLHPVASSGVWKLRGGGRLELEIRKSDIPAEAGRSQHLTIESVGDEDLIFRGEIDDDPDELTRYLRGDPPEPIPASPE